MGAESEVSECGERVARERGVRLGLSSSVSG